MPPQQRHPTRMTLDVVMEDFWTRPTGVYSKPVWIRPNVLQIVYDDDNDLLSRVSGPNVPGGHSAYTRTAAVYSDTPITDEDIEVRTSDPRTESLRKQVSAFVQRVRNCYLVEANILGFAANGTGLEEQCVLSSAIRWALSDYQLRFQRQPSQIVLHLDVNGSLALGDVAGSKSMSKMASGLATDMLQRVQDDLLSLGEQSVLAVKRAKSSGDDQLTQEYTVSYSGNDFVRSVMECQGALAIAAIRDIEAEISDHTSTMGADGSFQSLDAMSVRRAKHAAATELESPALTVAIRTNGVEHRQASVYVQRMMLGVLGIELSEENDTVRRYVVTHEDVERGLFFHPVLLEKLHKSKGAYSFGDYCEELSQLNGKTTVPEAWQHVSNGTLKKSDDKYSTYLGLASKPMVPPKLDIAFAQETWLMPRGKYSDYKLKDATPTDGPWWAGFTESATGADSMHEKIRVRLPSGELAPTHPYCIAISSEPVPGVPMSLPAISQEAEQTWAPRAGTLDTSTTSTQTVELADVSTEVGDSFRISEVIAPPSSGDVASSMHNASVRLGPPAGSVGSHVGARRAWIASQVSRVAMAIAAAMRWKPNPRGGAPTAKHADSQMGYSTNVDRSIMPRADDAFAA